MCLFLFCRITVGNIQDDMTTAVDDLRTAFMSALTLYTSVFLVYMPM